MAEINNIQARRTIEAETKRSQMEAKKLQSEHYDKFKKITTENEATITDLKRNYENTVSKEQNDLEIKLANIREKHVEQLRGENLRLDSELADLKKIHNQKLQEMKDGQEEQLERIHKDNTVVLENSKEKVFREKLKNA